MNILRDRTNSSYTIVLDKVANSHDTKLLSEFVQDAFLVPEQIGGVYFLDLYGQEHRLEFKNESLYALLLTIDAIAHSTPVTIQYAHKLASVQIWSEFWHIPQWLVNAITFIFRPDMTYKKLFHYAQLRTKISEPASKQ